MNLPSKKSVVDALVLVAKGILMGTANKIPGVSGGIIALVFGFYHKLIQSFQNLNINAFNQILNFQFKSFWRYINGSFLSLVFGGVVISYFSVSLLLDYLFKINETIVIACFFGMILASLFLIIKKIDNWKKSVYFFSALGFVAGLSLSFVRPMDENDNLFFIFFCGIISVSGMTVPGLSGSFLLLVLGNYNLLLVDAVSKLYYVISEIIFLNFTPFTEPYTRRFLVIISFFTLGSLFGLVIFSNILKFILDKFPNQTISTIIGFISGTLILIYPWKVKEYLYDVHGNLMTNSVGNGIFSNYQYYLPNVYESKTYFEFLSIIFGIIIILVLNHYEKRKTT